VDLRRTARLAGLGLGLAVYVWFAAVRSVGAAKARKAALRALREA